MTTPKYAQMTRKLFAEGRPALAAPPPPSPATRASAIDAIEKAIVADAQRHRRRRLASAVAVAAAFAIAVSGASWLSTSESPPLVAVGSGGAMARALDANRAVLRLEGTGAFAVGSGSDTAVADGSAVAEGDRLVTRSSGRALLSFASGTEVALDPRGDLTVLENAATQRFSLAAGTVTARVAKIASGHRFVIGTNDSEIEVRGTAFRVSIVAPDPACGDGATTRVDVFEGTVVVRRAGVEAAVSAGERWPSGCLSVAANEPATPAIASTTDSKKLAVAPSASPSSPSSSSRLAEQNDLFAEAVAAKRRGATGTAIAAFERFAATYPRSPLADSAMAERMKLLRTVDKARARDAARQYLDRYPVGSARGIAQAIVSESP
jgi:hypothetical protein